METEYNPCPINPNHSTHGSKAYFFPKGPCFAQQCPVCGTWRLQPRLTEEEMIKYYKKDDYFEGGKNGYDSYSEQEESLKETFGILLDNVMNIANQNNNDGSLFEIGCATGQLLRVAKEKFKYVYGTDFSKGAVKKASKHATHVFEGGIDSIPVHFMVEHGVSLVIATNVIEHIHDPLSFLKKIKKLMPEGAALVLTTPDAGSYWRKCMGKYWPSFIIPEHIYCFTQDSLNELMILAGFKQVRSVKNPHVYPIKTILKKLHVPDFMTNKIPEHHVTLKGVMAASYGIKED